MNVDMAKVNRMIAELEASIDAAQKELADAQRLQAATSVQHKQDLEKMNELIAKREAASDAVSVIAEKAIAKARALEHFVVSKGLWEEFRATAAQESFRR